MLFLCSLRCSVGHYSIPLFIVHIPLHNFDASFVMLLTLLYYCQISIRIATPSHMLMLLLQIRSIKNIESTMFNMIDLPPKSWMIQESTLWLKNLCFYWISTVPLYIVANPTLRSPTPNHYYFATVILKYDCISNTNPTFYWILWAPIARWWSMMWNPQWTLPNPYLSWDATPSQPTTLLEVYLWT